MNYAADGTAALLREREARSLLLLVSVVMAGFLAVTTNVTVHFARAHEPIGKMVLVYGYVGVSLLLGAVSLYFLRKRQGIEIIGVLVALSASAFAAIVGIVMWKGFVPGAPATLLTKLPIAAAGMAGIGCMSLTLRPLHVVIAGAGVAATLAGFVGLTALDPATRFVSFQLESYFGPAVSLARLATELTFVTVVTIAAAVSASLARRTLYQAVALQRTTDHLSRYFSPAIAQRIREGDDALLRPGGREQEVVVLFADLTGFTRACAALPADQVLVLLSQYHRLMVDEIFKAGGTLDKFIGDGVMATFGTPNPTPDDADRAVQAARGMLRAMAELNAERRARGEEELPLRIGLHAGPAIVGNVGTEQRLEFTVVGDTVNVASRIEAACKRTGKAAMASAAVVKRLTRREGLEPVPPIMLDGQPEPLELYGLLSLPAAGPLEPARGRATAP